MKNLSKTLPTGPDRAILLRFCVVLGSIGLAVSGVWNLYEGQEQRLQASRVLIRDACVLRHAAELRTLGDSFVDRRMLFVDFAEIWREKREDFKRDCLGKDA